MAASAGFPSPDPEHPHGSASASQSAPAVSGADTTEDNAFLPITIGTGGWLIAGVALLVLRDRLPLDSRWWIGSCAVGVISGLGGMIYVRRRAGRPRRAAARRARQADQA